MLEENHTTPDYIPLRLVIGVTGHRVLKNEVSLSTVVRQVLHDIQKEYPAKRTPVVFTILSPLAEGADRLVVREVLKLPGSRLEAVLPMNKDEYSKDFPDSIDEFEELLKEATRVKTLTPSEGRDKAYAEAGRYVVDHCDILIALWNGQPAAGHGGTADTIRYAVETECPLCWIHSEDPARLPECDNRWFPYKQVLQELEEYNAEALDAAEISSGVEAAYEKLSGKAKQAGFDIERVKTVYETTLRHYARSDKLALKYQRRYHLAGLLVYTLAALAVAVAATQIFEDMSRSVPLIEVVLMAAVLLIIWRGHRNKWHHKYMNYRSLAERLRSELFMSLGTFDIGGLTAPRRHARSTPRDWIAAAFFSVWSEMLPSGQPDEAELAALKRYMCEAWLQDQIDYHKKAHDNNKNRNKLLLRLGAALFSLTLLVAAIHFMGNYHKEIGQSLAGTEWGVLAERVLESVHEKTDRLLILIAIVAPAVGGALGAIRTQREYLRIARRHEQTAQQLEDIKRRFEKTERIPDLLRLMREAEEIMLRENEDWRTVVEVREIELPA